MNTCVAHGGAAWDHSGIVRALEIAANFQVAATEHPPFSQETNPMDMPINHFKHAIQSGQKQIGLWSHLCSNISTEILAHCGFDWLLLDMEHSPNDLSEILAQCKP